MELGSLLQSEFGIQGVSQGGDSILTSAYVNAQRRVSWEASQYLPAIV